MRSKNNQIHYLGRVKSTIPPAEKGAKQAASMGLVRIAGNVFECPSSKDLWKVEGSKVIRLSSSEVDNDESLKPANKANPSKFLKDILAELEL
jgi:hypothetical protein